MSAMALFAAQRGIETGLEIKGALDSQAMARVQSENLKNQMAEIEARTQMDMKNIHQQADKVVATQQAAFITGGVKLTGSAMSVISDTLNNEAQAAYVRQREADYSLIGIASQKAGYDNAASNETLYLNLAAAGVSGIANLAMDKYKYGRMHTQDRGAVRLTNKDGANSTNQGKGFTSQNGSSGLGDAYA